MKDSVDNYLPKSTTSVLIVGAGPVGLLLALHLGQAGVDTLLIEGHEEILPTTRAMVYMPVVIPVLEKLGIREIIESHAFLNREGIFWRDVDGNRLAHLPLGNSNADDFGGVLLLGQWKMAKLILEELKKYPSVEVRFGLKCVGIEDSSEAETVKIMVNSHKMTDPDLFLKAKYVVGCDGANSSVRRMCCIPFEGFTYSDWKMVGSDVVYDFTSAQGFGPVNFIVHPKDWAVIAYTGQDAHGQSHGSGKPLWRVAYVEPPDLPGGREDYVQRAQDRMKTWIKTDNEFQVLRAEPYINSQRCAATARKGRILLAGDALHSNNPIGGLGLTGGILDAFAYGNALRRVLVNKESDNLLTDCADSRKQTWMETTNELSQANLRRLQGFDEGSVKARQGFFDRLETDGNFPKLVRAGFDKMLPETFE